MAAPGTSVTVRDDQPPRSAPTDTSPWFVAGLTAKGPQTPVACDSLQSFISHFGGRVTWSLLYDSVEAFFRTGGSKVYVSRVVGPAATSDTLTLVDASSAATLTVTARDKGTSGLKVSVTQDGTGFILTVTDEAGEVVDKSPTLAADTDAVAWGATASSVTVTNQVASALDPAALPATPLAGGTDDRASVTDTQWQAALDLFETDLGPGQVSFPGRTTAAAHAAVSAHADAHNRIGYLDAPDDTVASVLATAGTTARANNGAAKSAMWGPWAVAPGVVGGTTRDVPYSAVAAGLTARVDQTTGHAGTPAAGEDNGRPPWILGLKARFTEAERETLNEAGVNVARILSGGVVTYGFRTLANKAIDPLNWQLSQVRTDMEVVAKAGVVAERHVFHVIDGEGIEQSGFGGELAGMLLSMWLGGTLYGATPDDAFRVDVGPSVNTPQSISDGLLKAVLSIRRSPFAERVEVEIVKRAITEAV